MEENKDRKRSVVGRKKKTEPSKVTKEDTANPTPKKEIIENKKQLMTIRDLIVANRYKEVLDALYTLIPDEENHIILLQSRFNSLKKSIAGGTITAERAGIERARITNALTDLVKENDLSGTEIEVKASIVPPIGGNERSTSNTSKNKILFLAANPSGETRIETDREHRIIKAEMERGSHRDTFEFLPPQFAVTITELLRAMNDKPNFVHFSGHGLSDGIIITKGDNTNQLVPNSTLKRLFRTHKNNVKLVLLNCCYSATQAKVISATTGEYVIGHNLPIGDNSAISFATGLYNGLSEGKSIEDAYNDAMIVLETENGQDAELVEIWKNGEKLDW